MATVTHRNATADTGATPNTSNPSFTPTQGDLVCVYVVTSGSSGTAGTMTASANGITFTNAGTAAAFGADAHTLNFFVANQLVGASPSGMTVTWTPTDPGTGTVIFVFTVAGMTNVGLAAIRQQSLQNNQTTGTPAPTFASNALTGNPTIGCVGLEGAGTSNTAVEPSGWTERGDTGYASPTIGAEYCSRDSGFTGTTITWTSVTVTIFASMFVELDAGTPAALPSLVMAPRTPL